MIDRNITQSPISDLADFYTRWPSLRGIVDEVIACEELTSDEREVVVWLKRLADRVGPQDLADPDDDVMPYA